MANKYRDEIDRVLALKSRKEIDEDKKKLAEHVHEKIKIIMETVVLNEGEKDSPIIWNLAMLEIILALFQATYEDDKDKFIFVTDTFLKQFKTLRDVVLERWDNG